MQNIIPYKGIVHNVLNDAPFIGAIVVANACSRGCRGCINETLKSDHYTRYESVEGIIASVRSNGLNEGIIFSGLEWSEQSKDLVDLVGAALNAQLKVMIYTHHTERVFFNKVPELKGRNLYIKFGAYLPEERSENHYSHTVRLATRNQYIKHFSLANSV